MKNVKLVKRHLRGPGTHRSVSRIVLKEHRFQPGSPRIEVTPELWHGIDSEAENLEGASWVLNIPERAGCLGIK